MGRTEGEEAGFPEYGITLEGMMEGFAVIGINEGSLVGSVETGDLVLGLSEVGEEEGFSVLLGN